MSGKKTIETVADNNNLTVLTPTKIDLRNAHAIRRELGSVYRDMRSKKIDAAEGTKLAYVLEMLRKSYETAVLEDRLNAIESKLKK